MDTLQYRGKARVVAYVDLILTSMALLVVILLAIFAGAFTAVASNPDLITKLENRQAQDSEISESEKIDPATTKEILVTSAWIMWIAVAVAAVLTAIQLWAAVKLLNATDVGRQLHEALSKAATWRNVTVVFLIFQIAGGLIAGRYLSTVIGVVIRGIFLFIVHKFMSEVNSRLTMSAMSGPTGVTVKN